MPRMARADSNDTAGMETPDEVMSRLRQMRSLRFESCSAVASGWDGHGTGQVLVEEPGVGIVVFQETGTWQSAVAGRAPVSFRNVFRWTAHASALRLEHLRHGADSPVWLFDLAPGDHGRWQAIDPHVCGQDGYAASLWLEGETLHVAWTITGPCKRERLRYAYSTLAGPAAAAT